MKKKIQHDAVNNQEDENSCAYPICFTSNKPVEEKEDKSIVKSNGHLFNETPANEGELIVASQNTGLSRLKPLFFQ